MALDEKILHRYIEDGIPVLRLYGWAAPSFTYGVSQVPELEIDTALCASDGIQIARRMTGGGVFFHHDEITYSLVCGKVDIGEPEDVMVSYRQISAFLISFYESLGLSASFALENNDFKNRRAPHQLCAASREKYDIVIDGRKIGGNAQKRKKRAIFQHGSIPLNIDWEFMRRYVRNLPEHISLNSTTLTAELKNVPDKQALEQKLIDAFSACIRRQLYGRE
ncbi:MAG: lipoate--protein ligase family protein [Candidatus Omnitrophota bacterium]|nr:lipoate--protein ligase family protein [Candidatus Omnitrophota bacterium]